MPPVSDTTVGRASRYGVWLIVTGVVAGVLSVMTIGRLREIAGDQDLVVPGAVAWVLDSPGLVALMALPAVVCGVLVLIQRHATIPLLLIGSLSAIIVVVLLMAAMVALIGPMYQYQPL